MRNKFYTFTVLWILCLGLNAQQYVDLANLSYLHSPGNNFPNSNEQSDIYEANLTLSIPVPLSDSVNLITGLYTEAISAELFPGSTPTDVYSINPRIGLNLVYNERWKSNFILLPKVSSDMNGQLTGRDYQIGAYALFSYRKHERLSYKFGGYYNSELFGPFFVPILGLYYTSADEKYEVNLNLPIAADANLKIAPKIRAGLSFNGLVRTYQLQNDRYLAKASNELCTYLMFHFGESIFFRARAGYSIGRYFRVYNNADKIDFGLSAFRFGDQRQSLNPDFSDGLILNGSLIYRFFL